MIPTYKDKRDIKSNKLRKLLLQINIKTVKNNLFTKSTIQERKKMKMKTKERRKLSVHNRKHFKRKQDPFLQFETFSYYKNRYIRLHYRNDTLTRKRIHNVHVKDYKLNRTKL